jgi:predicted aspartyl protease
LGRRRCHGGLGARAVLPSLGEARIEGQRLIVIGDGAIMLDSGAADVSVPSDVVSTLMRTGTLTAADFRDQTTYRLADGSTVPSRTFRIRSLKLGDKVFENVTGSIASAQGDLLLGQSFLGRLKSWSIDNSKQILVLE